MKVLFVCMGNICRSPTAEGVFRHRVEAKGLAHLITIDSAGTHSYHCGNPPDARSQKHALRRGYDLSAQRARQLEVQDFERFDLILTMDSENLVRAEALCAPQHRHKLRAVADFFTQSHVRDVPDPYYGGDAGFEEVLDLLEDAADGLLAHYFASSRSDSARS